MTDSEAIELLERAQAGDESATYNLAVHVFERQSRRISRFYSLDPAYSREDIQGEFMEGILCAIPIVDLRTNPIYHLGTRGVWHVQTVLRASRRIWRRTEDVDAMEVPERHADPLMDVVERLDARGRVIEILGNESFNDTDRRVIEAILTGRVDPEETGFNKAVAKEIDRSPQMASLVMQRIRRKVAE